MKNQWAMIIKTEKCNTKKTYSCIGNMWVVGSLLNFRFSRHRLEGSFVSASPDFESSFLWPNSSDQPSFYWCFRSRRLENQDILLLLWTSKDKLVLIWKLYILPGHSNRLWSQVQDDFWCYVLDNRKTLLRDVSVSEQEALFAVKVGAMEKLATWNQLFYSMTLDELYWHLLR